MAGQVERATREHVGPEESLRTPTGSATSVVHELNETGVVLLLGDKETRTTLSWECLEGITEFPPGTTGSRSGRIAIRPGTAARSTNT